MKVLEVLEQVLHARRDHLLQYLFLDNAAPVGFNNFAFFPIVAILGSCIEGQLLKRRFEPSHNELSE